MITALLHLRLMIAVSLTHAIKSWKVSRLEYAGVCSQCGHDREIDRAESLAPDVPGDEVFVQCSIQGHPDCDQRFISLGDLR